MKKNDTGGVFMKNLFPLPILLFDNECSLCLRFKQSLERIPGTENITMVPIQNEDIYKAFPLLDPMATSETIHLINEQEQILKGSQVISYLIKKFPLVKNFAWLAESEIGNRAIEYFHDMVDRARKDLIRNCNGCGKHG